MHTHSVKVAAAAAAAAIGSEHHLLLTANKMTVPNNHKIILTDVSIPPPPRAFPGLSSFSNNAFGFYVIQITKEPDLEMMVVHLMRCLMI